MGTPRCERGGRRGNPCARACSRISPALQQLRDERQELLARLEARRPPRGHVLHAARAGPLFHLRPRPELHDEGTGEAGIGKTTLVKAFLGEAGGGAAWIGRGQCVEYYGADEAYQNLALPVSKPVVSKRAQAGKHLPVARAVRSRLAGDDVVRMAHGKALHVNVAPPRLREALDPVGREHQIEVERTVLELHEVLATLDLRCLRLRQIEAELPQRSYGGSISGRGSKRGVWRLVNRASAAASDHAPGGTGRL